MADPNLQIILQQLQAEKNIDRNTLIEAVRSALESAARKSINQAANLAVDVDPNTLEFKVFEIRSVVEEIEDPVTEMNLAQAQALNPNAKVGDRLKVLTEPKDFGRIAAQTAKQVIIQKVKDAEREHVYEEFKQREGELITGIVKRVHHGNVIVAIGNSEAILPPREQSPRENFKPGDRIRAYLVEVDKTPRGPQVVLSRTSPELVKALFDQEVPEIYDGTIEIRGVAREPGNRTKIAVYSKDAHVDAVGACVGMRGSRVRTVVEELNGEKIDIVRWSSDPIEFCGNALNPADILDISVDEANKSILVIVPHDQLSLAIGKRGQNARLASRLMGWNIDIKSDVEITGPPPADETEAPVESSEAIGAGDGNLVQEAPVEPGEANAADGAVPQESPPESAGAIAPLESGVPEDAQPEPPGEEPDDSADNGEAPGVEASGDPSPEEAERDASV